MNTNETEMVASDADVDALLAADDQSRRKQTAELAADPEYNGRGVGDLMLSTVDGVSRTFALTQRQVALLSAATAVLREILAVGPTSANLIGILSPTLDLAIRHAAMQGIADVSADELRFAAPAGMDNDGMTARIAAAHYILGELGWRLAAAATNPNQLASLSSTLNGENPLTKDYETINREQFVDELAKLSKFADDDELPKAA